MVKTNKNQLMHKRMRYSLIQNFTIELSGTCGHTRKTPKVLIKNDQFTPRLTKIDAIWRNIVEERFLEA